MMFTILDGRTELWQWDLDRKIVVEDASIAEVHFCNGLGNCSLVCAVRTEDGKRIADIPNILLQEHPQCKLRGYFELRIFAYCAGDYTKTEATIKVNARTKPESYEYTETAEVKYKIAEILQTKGNSGTAVMSQNAVSVELDNAEQKISRVEKRITNIERGVMPEVFETDDSMAYQKDVPANALPYAEVSKIGGMTYKDGDTLRSAKVTEVKSVGANLANITLQHGLWIFDENRISSNESFVCTADKIAVNPNTTYSLSGNAIIDFSGNLGFFGADGAYIGSQVYVFDTFTTPENAHYIAFHIDKSYVNNISGGVMLNKGSTALPYTPYVEHTLPIPEAVRPANGINENVYDFIEWAEDGNRKQVVRCGVVDLGTVLWNGISGSVAYTQQLYKPSAKVLCVVPSPFEEIYINSSGSIVTSFPNGAFTSIEEVKAAMQGVMLVCELAEPIVTDISNLITSDNLIGVEGNGTITFENEYGNAVPSEITYQLKGATA
jgi:hypothetical protein